MSNRTWLWAWLLVPGLAAAATADAQLIAKVFTSKPDAARGAQLFDRCTTCHARDGNGVVAGTVPRIAGQHYRVVVRQIVDFRLGRRWDMRMEPVAQSHGMLAGAQDIADVALFVAGMSRDGIRGIGDGTHLERGAALYEQGCVSCHGAGGDGDERTGIPRIGGQHAVYLAQQIYDAVDGRRLPLTRTHRKRFEPLSFEEVLGLTDYIARMGWHADASGRRERNETDGPISR
jgi:cytochrome c553